MCAFAFCVSHINEKITSHVQMFMYSITVYSMVNSVRTDVYVQGHTDNPVQMLARL